jgi:acetylornithine deacetylase
MQCTIVNSGTQHNVVPDECRFTIDVRTNELYTNEEVFEFLKTKLKSDIKARSFHLHSSSLYKRPSIDHADAQARPFQVIP